EGEVDRTMLERITPCLEHMIRNSIDHGIESGEKRLELNKPQEAEIQLSFSREAGDIVIVLEDDGRGLDIAAIRQKALKQGLISEDDNLTESELTQLIFRPGF